MASLCVIAKMNNIQNYGFQPPENDPNDFKFCSSELGGEVLMESADWRLYLPVFEHQRKNGLDVMSCVTFGTLSALEMIHKVKYGSEPNYSDRYTSTLAETTPTGNTPKKVAQAIRNYGTVKEEDHPFISGSWDEYFKPITDSLKKKGLSWLNDYEVGYEKVSSSQLKKALKTSPIGVAVSAWKRNNNGEYERFGASNHWAVLVAYEGDNPIVWDSYEESLKKLSADHNPEYAMRYELKKKPKVYHRNWIRDLLKGFLFGQ